MFLAFRVQVALPSVGSVRLNTYGDKNDHIPSLPIVAGPTHWMRDEIADHKYNVDDLILVPKHLGCDNKFETAIVRLTRG